MPPTPHPDQKRLADYATGKLAEDEASSVAQHLTECPECESTIEALEAKSETIVSGLADKAAAEPYAGETELRRAVANVAKIPAGAPSQISKPVVSSDKVSTKAPVKLGPYQLLAKLGEGGMGAVFKARHEHLDKLVAIKVLPKKAMADPAAVARFRREMKAVGALHHPNIVGAHDAGEAMGVHFLVMEYVAGSDLSSLLKKSGPVTVEQAVSYMTQAAKGLAFAHAKNIVHRDIKPANLLVDAEGTVKILDMGLARLDDSNVADAEANQGLTQTGQVMGTVDYMAPEQAFDTHRADAKADVYSLGCTLYRILTGENAFRGDTVVQKILAHREQPIPSLQKLCPAAPAALDSLYQRMMAKQPDGRPSMAEVAKELEAIATKAPPEPSGPSIVIDVQKKTPVRREAVPIGHPQVTRDAGRGKKPPRKLIAAGLGGFALICLGVWIYIKTSNGKTALHVPDQSQVEVKQDGSIVITPPPAAPTATASATAVVTKAPPSLFFPTIATTNATNAPPSGEFALRFDGPEDKLDTSSISVNGRNPWTLEAWVTARQGLDAGGRNSLVLMLDPVWLGMHAGGPDGLNWTAGGPTSRPGSTRFASGKVEIGKRTHVALVRDSEGVSLYVNGVLHGDPLPIVFLSNQSWVKVRPVGSPAVRDVPFRGDFDEVRLSSTNRYRGNFTPPAKLESDADTTALYHFDEGAGDILHDASGNKHDGQIVGATWVRADGGKTPPSLPTIIATSDPVPGGNNALQFDGKSAHVLIPTLSFDDQQEWTLEATATHDGPPVEFGPGILRLGGKTGKVLLNVGGRTSDYFVKAFRTLPDSAFRSEIAIPQIRKTRFAVTASQQSVQLYIDGRRSSHAAAQQRSGEVFSDGFVIGGNPPGSNLFFPGTIDEVRISKIVRYNGDYAPQDRLEADADTVALYHFDEGAGDVLRDASGNKHDGKIVGATWVRNSNPPATSPSVASQTLSGAELFDLLTDDERWQWSEPESLGPALNAKSREYVPSVSGDGLSIVFFADRPSGLGKWDLWLADRKSPDEPFGEAVNLGPAVNSAENEMGPWLSADGLTLIFSRSHEKGDTGELLMSTRSSRNTPFGPAALVPGDVQTQSGESGGALTADGRVLIVATSNFGNGDLRQSIRNAVNQPFPATVGLGEEINDADLQRSPWLSPDGQLLLFGSIPLADDGKTTIKGGLPWAAWRPDVNSPFVKRKPIQVPTSRALAGQVAATSVSLTADGRTLFFSIGDDRPESENLWCVRRVPKVAAPAAAQTANAADPAFDTWLKETQALPADKQLAAVSKKLMELNPGFDGKLLGGDGYKVPKIEKGVVTGIGFVTDHVTDIKPVRAFPGLRDLYCRGSMTNRGPTGILVDLSPLAGLPLQSVIVDFNPVQDLTPLRGMQLRLLGIAEAKTADLSPLVGMPLETLSMNSAWNVKDIGPLRGMPLKKLTMNGKSVSDLSPLAGMKLESLAFAATPVADISVLRGMPLNWIDMGNTKVDDLTPLHDCKTLKSMMILNHPIGPEKIAALQQALPDCKIEWDDPAKFRELLKEPDPERRVALWVSARGGKVKIDVNGTSREITRPEDLPREPFIVGFLSRPMNQPPITPEEWQSLGELRWVSGMDFSGCDPTDDALAAIGRCQTLQYLVLAFDDTYGDAGLAHLSTLPRLGYLDINNCAMTAEGLKHLGKLTTLTSLQLGSTKSMDLTSLAPLASLQSLENLGLNFTSATDAAVADLTKLPRLRQLNLSDTRATPAVVDSLLRMPNLRIVSLNGVKLTVESLAKLAAHPTLTVVGVYGAGIKPEQYETLIPTLPRITLVHQDLQSHYADELAAYDWAQTVGSMGLGHYGTLRDSKAAIGLQTGLNLTKAVAPEELRKLAPLKNLTTLVVNGENSTDDHLRILFESLKGYPHLDRLIVNPARFTSVESLADLPRHTDLTSLHFGRSDVLTDETAAMVAKLPQLRSVNLEWTLLTDKVFESLATLADLQGVAVQDAPQVTGAQLSLLKKSPRLSSIRLDGCGIVDASLAALPEMPELDRLSLESTPVTDAGLEHLAGCRALRNLNLLKTKVSAAAVAKLQQALPDCRIVWDGAK